MSLWSVAPLKRPILAALAVITIGFSGCGKPTEVGPNEAMQQGTAAVTVTDYSLEYIDLETPTGAVAVSRPVLKVELNIEAIGEEPVRWNPGFDSTSATQVQNVLLFHANSWEDGLSPANHIGALSTSGYTYLDDPITEPVEIAPGESARDIILFSAPPSSAQNLLLSIPPQIFGAETKFPGYIRLPFSAQEAKEPEAVGVNEDFEGREFTFKVTKTAIVYPAMKDAEGKEAVSRDPLLRVDFSVKNTSDSPLNYVPSMLSSGVDFPALTDQRGALQNRVTFGPGIEVVGQTREAQTIAPGKSLNDFILFDRPTRGVETLLLTVPGRRVGGSGLIRATFPYTWENPEVPADFKPKQ